MKNYSKELFPKPLLKYTKERIAISLLTKAFVNNFKNKGGIFIYIENPIELPNILQTILLDKGADSLVFSHNEQVEALFSAVPHTFFY